MREGDFELDGVTWGRQGPLLCTDFDPGAVEVRDQDQARTGGHGVLQGRDWLGGVTWTWEISTHREDVEGALGEGSRIAAVWRSYLADPAAGAWLRYMAAGRVRRVYGRPRRFVPPKHDVLGVQGAGKIIADFALADPVVYQDEQESLTLALTQAGGEGVRLPAVLPWVLGSAPGQRQGQVAVTGDADVPFSVTFSGPVSGSASGWWASGRGWRVEVDASIAWDQSITVDTRAGTVTRSDGRSLAGKARGRFLAARLAPGGQEVAFGATDPTGTATARLAWRPGWHSL